MSYTGKHQILHNETKNLPRAEFCGRKKASNEIAHTLGVAPTKENLEDAHTDHA